jgi:hypothetical protein
VLTGGAGVRQLLGGSGIVILSSGGTDDGLKLGIHKRRSVRKHRLGLSIGLPS